MPPTDEVYIWLGANVMLAYPMDEAETLLVERLGKAKKSLVDCEEDAEFLREQITVSSPDSGFTLLRDCQYSHPARRWRLQQPECTTGTSCRSARRRARRRAKKRTRRPVVAEQAARWGRRESQHRESYCRPVTAAHGEGRVQLKRPDPRAGCIHGSKGWWASRAPRTGPSRPAKTWSRQIVGWLAVKRYHDAFLIRLSALYDLVRPTFDTLSGRMNVHSGGSVLKCIYCKPVIFHIWPESVSVQSGQP